MTFNWGILATGNISNSMAEGLASVKDANLVAVGSRSQENADTFGRKWSVKNRYSSYEELVQDPEVEIVYIGTPHSHHFENMVLCLNHGKHVLCEKAFTLNARQAEICIQLAREKSLFLMEAMWMRFFPAFSAVRSQIKDGVIGELRYLQADFFHQLPFDPHHRLFAPELGGGSLLDLGIYPLSLAYDFFGQPEAISGRAVLGRTGVDELDAITLSYNGGGLAQLACGTRVQKPAEAYIIGSAGWIKIHDRFFAPEWVTIRPRNGRAKKRRYRFKGNGYPHEVEEVHRCLRNGELESPIMPLQETLALMEAMDALRGSWGVRYPAAGESLA